MRVGFALLLCCFGAFAVGKETVPRRPNVVLILVDDLGWTDLGCYGSEFYETPHIDQLAADGMRFTNAYSACTVCSPTRAAVMTGKHPARLHITNWIPGFRPQNRPLRDPDWTQHLPLEETTIAEALGQAGYRTAHIGKWHLGPKTHWPEHQGFDLNVAGHDKGSPPGYFYPYRRRNRTFPNLPGGEPGEQLTDRLTSEAIEFIEANREQPFFLYLPYYAVHTPIQGKKPLVEKFRGKVKPEAPHDNPVYAAMIATLDENVGRLRQALERLKLDENTIIIFTSDNGGLVLFDITSNQPLRAGKGSVYEGGVRVPGIIHWPGVTQAGGVSHTPIISHDLFPTILDMCGVEREELKFDGVSLAPLLTKGEALNRSALYWHFPHYHQGGAAGYGAVRDGDYRLIEFYETGKLEMYNLREDVGETKNLAALQPERARSMHKQLKAWRQRVGAQMPLRNPAASSEKVPGDTR